LSVLRTAGALQRTVVIFTSDNGFMTGQHRVREGKIVPYEPSIRVPLLMRGPGVPAGVRRAPLVWNGDLAPTIMEAAGARAPWPLDGASLWPVLRGRPLRRDLLLEGPPLADSLDLPRFVGLRTERYVFVKHITTEVELYDLWRDPYQLQNLARDPGMQPVRAELARRLRQLVDCRGRACRVLPGISGGSS
jgi:N-acetylglucosamine-6-sulfatase